MNKMKATITIIILLVLTTTSHAQHYKTTGILQYQKVDGVHYKATLAIPSLPATWDFYTDNKLVRVREGDKVVMDVKRKYRSGASTVYVIDQIVDEMKIIITGNTLTTIEGDNEEIKSVYRITRTETINKPYGDSY